ncbi:MAG: ribonuclease HI family protein [Dehalococcoidales bacterium]|nr:ribonuclease HI family protein [Dehalococcoidales bacterium]
MNMKLIIHTDGLSKGNPGPGAIGATLKDVNGKAVASIAQAIGVTTNNVAEYKALIAALEKAHQLGAVDVEIRSDSELMVRQVTGRYKVKSPLIAPLYMQVNKLLSKFNAVKITHIPRELNAEADELANLAIKAKKMGQP